MSKPPSGLFSGTKGEIAFRGDAEDVIAARTAGLDLREHPAKQKQLGSKQRKGIRKKIRNRTATREEWKRIEWDRRIRQRRKDGVDNFWSQEAIRLFNGEKAPGTGRHNRSLEYLPAKNRSSTTRRWSRIIRTAFLDTHI